MWLSIRLPQLPLEALQTESNQVSAEQAQAVIQENRILCVNQLASQQGIQVGQTITNAFALCETIQLYQRKPQQEQQLLKNVAILVYPISSSVIIEPEGIIILEVARSLKLYKGIDSLVNNVRERLDEESINYQLALADSPTAAEILSFMPLTYSMQAISSEGQINSSKLERLLSKLSVQSMLLEEKIIQQFQSVGFKNIGQLKQLPYSSFQKRFGKKALNYLLKLFNQQADPRDFFQPEETFYQSLEFNEVIHHRQGLLFPIKRLLKNLVNFLHLQQKNSQYLEWKLFDSSKSTLTFSVVFSNANISLNNYLELTQLNLENHQLKEPIEGIALTAEKLSPLDIKTQELFEQAGCFNSNSHFINKIRAKLGSNSCLQLAQEPAHLPEQASIVSADVLPISKDIENDYQPHQPTWLLETPKPIRLLHQQLVLNGKLTIISSPQKIANNWWDSSTARDYYIAEHENGSLYWIFFDQLKKLWFLQGVYG
jgi:protein ImuB